MGEPGGGRGAAGFTLVEVVVALAITAMVAGAVYAALATAVDTSRRNEAVREETRARRNGRMVLSALLRGARADVARADARFRGTDGRHSFSGGDELQLVTALGFPFARLPAGEPLRVRLWVGPAPSGRPADRGLLAELVPWTRRNAPVDTVVLLPGVDVVEVTYRNSATGDWVAEWGDGLALPAAVRMDFQARPAAPSLVVGLPNGRLP